ncbi:hypothetical protein DP83_11860 [Vibrio metoecus]|uniref:PvuRts1 I-like SET and RING associated domain-containing protein n=1 Tax=Vibrio metoecus TaxID=1481663 RepID=A0ABR4RU90_VIBMT|nr:hypothetical protein DP83_11860 [Vibrio metoecus]
MEQNTSTYIERGYIDLCDDVAFDKIVSAVNCFGHNYAGWQRGGATHAYEDGYYYLVSQNYFLMASGIT